MNSQQYPHKGGLIAERDGRYNLKKRRSTTLALHKKQYNIPGHNGIGLRSSHRKPPLNARRQRGEGLRSWPAWSDQPRIFLNNNKKFNCSNNDHCSKRDLPILQNQGENDYK